MLLDTHLVESELSSESIFKGALLNVRKDRVLLPNGQESIREYIVHPGAVVILASWTMAICSSSGNSVIRCAGFFWNYRRERSIRAKAFWKLRSGNSRKRLATWRQTGSISA